MFAAQAGDFRHARAEANHLSGTAIFASDSAGNSAGIFACASAGVFAVNFANAFAADSVGIFASASAGNSAGIFASGSATIVASTFTSDFAEFFRDLDAAHFLAVFLWVADENVNVAFLSEGNQVYK